MQYLSLMWRKKRIIDVIKILRKATDCVQYLWKYSNLDQVDGFGILPLEYLDSDKWGGTESTEIEEDKKTITVFNFYLHVLA